MSTMDMIIRNGWVLDGNANPWFQADVGIEGKKITKVGNLSSATAERVIDAKDMIVAPGFIDIHNHSDMPLLVSGRGESMIRQGVTSVLTCNCGGSPFPLVGEARPRRSRGGQEVDWSTVDEYKAKLRSQGISINIGLQVGHGTVRSAVMGYEQREPTAGEMEEMKGFVAGAMEAGCFGMSSGLGYSPGMFAKTEEVVELCKLVGKYGGIYSTHARSVSTFPKNLEEVIEIGEKAGLPVQMSHIGSSTCGRANWGRARSVTLNIIDAARARGVDFTADIYPYTISGASLGMYVPDWAHEGGPSKMLERLADPEVRKRIREELPDMLRMRDWSQLLLHSLRSEKNKIYEGKTVQQVAEMRGADPVDVMCDLLIEEKGACPCWGLFGLETDIRTLMKHEAVMIGSDGSAVQPTGTRVEGHPRNYGAFARILETYVGDGVLTLTEAVHKMSGMPARRLGLTDRGVIKPGAYADITIFNPFLVRDKSTLEDPAKFPEGIPYVLVNGVVTVDNGEHTGATAGEILCKP